MSWFSSREQVWSLTLFLSVLFIIRLWKDGFACLLFHSKCFTWAVANVAIMPNKYKKGCQTLLVKYETGNLLPLPLTSVLAFYLVFNQWCQILRSFFHSFFHTQLCPEHHVLQITEDPIFPLKKNIAKETLSDYLFFLPSHLFKWTTRSFLGRMIRKQQLVPKGEHCDFPTSPKRGLVQKQSLHVLLLLHSVVC